MRGYLQEATEDVERYFILHIKMAVYLIHGRSFLTPGNGTRHFWKMILTRYFILQENGVQMRFFPGIS